MVAGRVTNDRPSSSACARPASVSGIAAGSEVIRPALAALSPCRTSWTVTELPLVVMMIASGEVARSGTHQLRFDFTGTYITAQQIEGLSA